MVLMTWFLIVYLSGHEQEYNFVSIALIFLQLFWLVSWRAPLQLPPDDCTVL